MCRRIGVIYHDIGDPRVAELRKYGSISKRNELQGFGEWGGQNTRDGMAHTFASSRETGAGGGGFLGRLKKWVSGTA